MAKRRTRKEKERALHRIAISWTPEPEIKAEKADVKGQFNFEPKRAKAKPLKEENAIIKAKDASLASIKRDILKSIILASLILALEVVIYLAWHVR